MIELLVVIAIIASLAALLLSALNRAKIAADSTACKSNLRQITLGMHMYVQQTGFYPDRENWRWELPPLIGASLPKDNYTFTNNDVTGVATPASYLGPPQSVYACPGYNRVHGLIDFPDSYGSYSYNSRGWLDAWAQFRAPPPELWSQGLGGILVQDPNILPHKPTTPTPENRVTCPSDMIAMGDAPFWPIQQVSVQYLLVPRGCINFDSVFELYPFFYSEVLSGQPANGLNVQAMPRRHGGRWNMAFCDGHVENLKPKALFDFRNPDVARRWNSDHQPHNEQWSW